MTKSRTIYVCQECGSISQKWAGKCSDCGAWNSIHEEMVEKGKKRAINDASDINFETLESEVNHSIRYDTGNEELNRVLGSGLVKGSATLLGGDPGIGKSTILIQLCSNLGCRGLNCLYITGEESLDQVRMRANRLNVHKENITLLNATSLEAIISAINSLKNIDFLVIDSIQTVYSENFSSSPGTVTQVRACASEIVSICKAKNIAVVLVGHVTKDGQIAGPKVLEHIVDTVLYFEGDNNFNFRILRAVKNRFGGVNEIGVFEMSGEGLNEVKNPSQIFLSPYAKNISGACVFAGIEGTRPILIEVQALTAPSFLPTPRRSVIGWDLNRLSMIMAVISVRYGLNLQDKEVYLNIVGGLKISDPGLDLAAAAALISTSKKSTIDYDTVLFGEIGLSGEVRKIASSEARLKEAEKLGFKKAIVPRGTITKNLNLEIKEISHILELKDIL